MSTTVRLASRTRPRGLFPLVRHLSCSLTPWLARTALTPNQITTLALAAGLVAGWCVARGSWGWDLAGAGALIACYVLDNCDGEIARVKDLSSATGAIFDTAVDAVVHAAFFLALGYGTWQSNASVLWLWLGVAAAGGALANSAISLPREARTLVACDRLQGIAGPETNAALRDRLLYWLRELTRADFCFIVCGLAVLDALWLLLPAGALGAQVYWLTGLWKDANKFHV